HRHLTPGLLRDALGEAREDGRAPGRVDDHEVGHQGGDEEFHRGRLIPVRPGGNPGATVFLVRAKAAAYLALDPPSSSRGPTGGPVGLPDPGNGGIPMAATPWRHPAALLLPLTVALVGCEVVDAGEAPWQAYAPGYEVVAGVVQPVNDLPHPYTAHRNWGTLPDGRSWGSVSAIEADRD